MVKNEKPIYLLTGEDSPAKEAEIAKIKQEFLISGSIDFNSDLLYAKDIDLHTLQEKLLLIPCNAQYRVVVVREVQNLKPEIREFILEYSIKPAITTKLILDYSSNSYKDSFLSGLVKSSFVQAIRFKESILPDTFVLGRQIDSGKTDVALETLNRLLDDGTKPEMILGGLRFIWERNQANSLSAAKMLKALLLCDTEIKTGKLKAQFALEKLVLKLCSFSKFLGKA